MVLNELNFDTPADQIGIEARINELEQMIQAESIPELCDEYLAELDELRGYTGEW